MLLLHFIKTSSRLLALVSAFILAGCTAPRVDGSKGQLDLTSAQWELVTWSQQPMPPPGVHPVILRFDQRGDEGRVSGHAGCNRFSAPYVLRDPGEITIATPVATYVTCSPGAMEFEARLLDKLESMSTYKIVRNNLDLIAGDGHVLTFRARAKVGAEAIIKFIYVAPQRLACSAGAGAGEQPAMCLQVRENENEPWRPRVGGIAGFNFEPGVSYRLRVLEERVAHPTAGIGDTKWTLDLIVEQEIAR
jgi:heat shock protein HslJ